MNNIVACLGFTEYERGWGSRPDGYTLHVTLERANAFAKYYNDRFNTEASVPDCYTVPNKPYLVQVDDDTFQRVKDSDVRQEAELNEAKKTPNILVCAVWGSTNSWPRRLD